jgi:hypothetical protein
MDLIEMQDKGEREKKRNEIGKKIEEKIKQQVLQQINEFYGKNREEAEGIKGVVLEKSEKIVGIQEKIRNEMEKQARLKSEIELQIGENDEVREI